MFLSFIFLIFYRKTFTIYTGRYKYELPSFGFDENGTYLIEIDNIHDSDDPLQIAFLNKEQYKVQLFSFIQPFICNLDCPKYEINSTFNQISGIMTESDVLYPFLLRCHDYSFSAMKLKGHVEYKNPNSYLDNRLRKGIVPQMIICIIIFLLLIVWIGNWFYNFNLQIGLHYSLTATFLIFMFYNVLRFGELKALDKSDDSKGFTELRITCYWLAYTSLSFFMLLAANGFCIVADSVSRIKLIRSAVISILFISFLFFFFFLDTGSYQSLVMILALLSGFFYFYEIAVNIRKASIQVVALLLAESNSGLSGSTSVMFLKNNLYRNFNRIFLAIIILICLYLCLTTFSYTIDLWIIEFLGKIMELGILVSLGILFRLTKPSQTNYRQIDDENHTGLADDEIPLRELENPVDFLSSSNPNQPLLLQTPSGSQTVTAKFVNE